MPLDASRAEAGAPDAPRFESMTERFGLVIRPCAALPDRAALAERSARVRDLLRAAGAVLLRGFGFDLPAMEAFSSRLGSRFVSHHATAVGKRGRVTETTATVNLGGRAFAWHRERGYAPFAPDLLFFLCERPAREGGETFVSDGCAIFDALSDAGRELASRALVEYRYPLPRATWPLALGAASDAEAEAALARLAARLRAPEAISWQLSAQGAKLRYRAPMLANARWTGRPAFANQVIFRAQRTTLAGGGALPGWLLREARAAADANAYAIAWQPGDLALLDNSRVMHARGEVRDPGRRILVRMCHVDD